MINEIREAVRGHILWRKIKLHYHINDQKVILVLVGENKKIDYFALVHLNDFVRWTCTKEAVIFVDDRKTISFIKKMNYTFAVKVGVMRKEARERLYKFYSFDKFFDHIVFTYTSKPKENMLDRVLEVTEINEEEAVCLALYHLRKVPKLTL